MRRRKFGRYQKRSEERLVRFGIALPESQFIQLSEVAKKTGDSRNAIVSGAIRGLLESEKEVLPA